MSQNQKDYGVGDGDAVPLVPGALVAFRHYFVKQGQPPLDEPTLVPMAAPPNGDWDVYDPQRSVQGNFTAYCHGGYGHARLACKPDHPSPSLDCTCGFYASYFPDTDFYKSSTWALSSDGLGADPTWVTVRAVVEVSGKVIAGALGVRAEKIRIKALAVDWSKYEEKYDPYHLTYIQPAPLTVNFRRRRELSGRSSEVYERCDQTVREAAGRYGARFYGSVDEMHADHPQQDLKHLGINAMTQEELTEQRRRKAAEARLDEYRRMQSAFVQSAFADTGTAVISASDALKQTSVYLNGVRLDNVTFTWGTWDAIPAPDDIAPDTPMARAIEAKRNRPAPPGTGIDRRRKKL